ncbi:MAG TPA: hypothetical protein VGV35_20695, partial [Bryobacteraceae bacterium]|nr:hypothetical protein [Bryobacteraceae bacterium]
MSESGRETRMWEMQAVRKRRRGPGKLEWLLLLFGLASVDTYLWFNTSATLYQAYEDWAFDESMRGLT